MTGYEGWARCRGYSGLCGEGGDQCVRDTDLHDDGETQEHWPRVLLELSSKGSVLFLRGNAFGQQLKAADGAQRCDEQPYKQRCQTQRG